VSFFSHVPWNWRCSLILRFWRLSFQYATLCATGMASVTQDSGQKHLLLSQPLWLVVSSTSRSSEAQQAHTEILCKRISWMVAQTIAKQLVSVVNTSIWSVRCRTLLNRLSIALVV